jgi:thioredoxin-dependent peroxiredoxin
MIQVGKKAPTIVALDLEGNKFSLKNTEGIKTVLFFYPKDNTPTCTVEVKNFRDNYKKLKKAGFEVIGISADTVQSHIGFKNKHELPFLLLSDESRKTMENFGVWKLKTLFGKEYMGIVRSTFIIDENGKIEKIIEKVISKDAAEQIISLYK